MISHRCIRLAISIFISLLAPLCVVRTATSQAIDPTELSDPIHPVHAKPAILLGPRLGVNRDYHSGGFATIEGANCPKFTSGSGWGMLLGLTAEFSGGKSWSIVPALTYESRPGNFREALPDVQVLLNDVAVTQSVSATSDISYRILSAEVLYKQEIWTPTATFRASVAAGPVGSYVVGVQNSQYQDLEQPANARFINPDPTHFTLAGNGRRLVYGANVNVPGRNAFRFALKAGVQLEVGLFNNGIIMYPGLFYDLGLTDVTSSENWGLNSILFQVDFRRAF
ncbi:MAG TPA: hypothetical protein VHI13_03260 [Candidatus Kapabacteria bacterium]|nr:hypothetical protein [Candidatus Kapabacteria bacterium]